MSEEWLTYGELGERVGVSPEAARQKAIRYRWPRRPANDGKVHVRVDVEDVKASLLPKRQRVSDGRPTAEPPPVEQASDARALLAALEAHIVTLKETTAKAEADTNRERERADAERERADTERDRADELRRRLDQMTDDAAGLRRDLERRMAELSTMVERMRRPWWRRLAG